MPNTANVTEYGDRDIALNGEIIRSVVGSGVHGIAIEGTDDHDEMGVFIEPPHHVIGLHKPMDHYVFRTQPEGARSGPGDTDLVMYSLRKYLKLVAKGNPTALLPLYAPSDDVLKLTPLGQELRDFAPSVLSQQAVHRFLGFMNSQRDRLLGKGRQSDTPSRPELVEQYGYDVKYASHALRLAYQGREITRDGRLTLPMPEHERQHVRQVKQGEFPELNDVLRDIAAIQADIEERLKSGNTPLPTQPNLEALSDWCTRAHLRHWGWGQAENAISASAVSPKNDTC